MHAVKLFGKAQVEMGRELAQRVGRSVTWEWGLIRFDSEDAVELEQVARSAEAYWQRLGKRGKAKAAEELWRKFGEIVAAERYARSFETR